MVESAVGPAAVRHQRALAWGRDERRVRPETKEKSTGSDETFATDLSDVRELERELLRLAERTSRRMRRARFVGRTVTIKVRYSDFTTITRSRTVADATSTSREIYLTARDLLGALLPLPAPVRLLGVRVEHLVPAESATRQLVIGERDSGWSDVDRARDRAVDRFGSDALRPASLLRPASTSDHESTRGRARPPGVAESS
jgi:DNA polymerase-4